MAARFVVAADARVFLGRLSRLDPAAVVRLRPAGPGRTALWGRLPWGVLVTREVDAAVSGDVTVGAAELLAVEDGTLPRQRDRDWRWPLPPHPGEALEEIPARQVAGVAAAAAGTLRQVTRTGLAGRPVGSRVLREALLDHVAIVVEPPAGATGKVEVPQRLVQGVVRMGFLGRVTDATARVLVRRAERWVGLAARYGTGWLPPPAGPLSVRPVARP